MGQEHFLVVFRIQLSQLWQEQIARRNRNWKQMSNIYESLVLDCFLPIISIPFISNLKRGPLIYDWKMLAWNRTPIFYSYETDSLEYIFICWSDRDHFILSISYWFINVALYMIYSKIVKKLFSFIYNLCCHYDASDEHILPIFVC